MTRSRIVFAGTPPFSVPSLDAIHDAGADIVAVYCQPDRPAGRGRTTRACAVKRRAEALALPVRQPLSLRDAGEIDALRALDADLMVVVAYGQLLPADVLAAPHRGCVNVHASLLPRWRGAAPIQRAIAAGDESTGVTLMQMDRGLDTGPMLARTETAIGPSDTAASMHDRLSRLGAELLAKHLDDLVAGRCRAVVQDDDLATYAPRIEAAEAEIDWNTDAASIERRIRAFNPWPVCRTAIHDTTLRIFEAIVIESSTGAMPGTVLSSSRHGIDVACAHNVLRLLEVQKSGGRRLPVGDFLNGTKVEPGALLGATPA